MIAMASRMYGNASCTSIRRRTDDLGDPTAEHREHAGDDPERDRAEHPEPRDCERDTRAVDKARQDVAPDAVGSQEVGAARCRKDLLEVDLLRRIRCDQRSQDGREHDHARSRSTPVFSCQLLARRTASTRRLMRPHGRPWSGSGRFWHRVIGSVRRSRDESGKQLPGTEGRVGLHLTESLGPRPSAFVAAALRRAPA